MAGTGSGWSVRDFDATDAVGVVLLFAVGGVAIVDWVATAGDAAARMIGVLGDFALMIAMV